MALLLLGFTPPAAAQKCGKIPRVLIIQDRSGSMKELVSAKSKWDIARGALTSIANQYGTQLELGLMLYPHWPDTTSCAPGKVAVKPGLNHQSKIITALNKVYPQGNTPLAATLDEAVALVAAGTKVHHVILVTDGKETCLSPAASLTRGGTCQWKSGTNYRKCGGCGWQFCLGTNVWSTTCESKPDLFTCPGGQTCGKDALCKGSIKGSLTAKDAMKKLAAWGIKGHVIGFGAAVDQKTLKALAVAGGTGTYSHAANPLSLQAELAKIVAGINCCGNGMLDPGEKCDKKIAPGLPGACPTKGSCNDGKACTVDYTAGSQCHVICRHTPVTQAKSGDGCCPAGATSYTDSDCKASCGNGVLDAGETCDPGIAKGQKGACQLKCDDKNACTKDYLGGTACNPKCAHSKVFANASAGDGCCPKSPPNLINTQDPDCPPPCSPTKKTGCVDMCKGKTCPAGHFCRHGKCVPYPKKDGGGAPKNDGGSPDGGPGGGNQGGTGKPGSGPEVREGADLSTEGGCDCTVSSVDNAPLPLLLLALLALGLRRRHSSESR